MYLAFMYALGDPRIRDTEDQAMVSSVVPNSVLCCNALFKKTVLWSTPKLGKDLYPSANYRYAVMPLHTDPTHPNQHQCFLQLEPATHSAYSQFGSVAPSSRPILLSSLT